MPEAYHSTASPLQYDDGTIESIVVRATYSVGKHMLLDLAIPSVVLQGSAFGKFVMARCVENAEYHREGVHNVRAPQRTEWSTYLRRPLFITAVRSSADDADATIVTVSLPNISDPGYAVLRTINEGSSVNLLGPYGRTIQLPDHTRQLLLVAQSDRAPLALPAAEAMLDRGGRVTLVVREHIASINKDRVHETGTEVTVDGGLLTLFPIAVEIQAAADRDQWAHTIADAIAWSDAMLIIDPVLSPQGWADLIRKRRMLLDEAYAHILVAADLLCCTGACMSCVVPRANGSLTRACVHGPVFPLTSLVD